MATALLRDTERRAIPSRRLITRTEPSFANTETSSPNKPIRVSRSFDIYTEPEMERQSTGCRSDTSKMGAPQS